MDLEPARIEQASLEIRLPLSAEIKGMHHHS